MSDTDSTTVDSTDSTTMGSGTTTSTTSDAAPDTSTTSTADASTTSDDPGDDGKGKGSRDAARYRTQLRATEAERDTLRGRVEALQRAEVARLAGETLAVPEDVFTVGGVELADLLTDAGDVDPARVSAAVGEVVKARPGLGRPTEPRDYGQGRRSTRPAGDDWRSAFARR